MRMFAKRAVSLISAMTVAASFAVIPAANAEESYSCDLMQLVRGGADTYYGAAEDVIELDEYTTAVLTYEGTYVGADGKVYLKSDTISNKDGRYKNGSYISFTAPGDGTLTVSGADISWFEGDTYMGYSGGITVDATGGTTYNFGYRKDSTFIDSITFVPDETGGSEVPEEPSEEPEGSSDVPVYTPPETVWDLDSYELGTAGANMPYLTGNAVNDGGEVKFPSGTRDTGGVTLALDTAAKGEVVTFGADLISHDRTLGSQYVDITMKNSEDEAIAALSLHPYSAAAEYGSNTFTVCGTEIASGEEVRSLFTAVGTTHIELAADFNAGKASVRTGETEFTGDIDPYAARDIKTIEITCRRTNSTVESRYISTDNISLSESDSETEPAPGPEGFDERTFGGLISRVAAADAGTPLVMCLSDDTRFGTDNISQLYAAMYFFEDAKGSAVLAAPQTETGWDIAALEDYIAEAKEEYGTSETVVIGMGKGADAAYALAENGVVDRMVPIAGTAELSGGMDADVWAFGGFLDEKVSIGDIRKPVNALQSAGADVRYTEYPADGHGIAAKAAAEPGLKEWILSGAEDSRTVDLVLFAGQSNMAGRGDAAEAVVCEPGEGYELHAVSDASLAEGELPYVLSTVTEPFGKNENNNVIYDSGSDGADRRSGDMVSAFMKAYYEKTGVPIVGVQASRGGMESKWFLGEDVKTEMQRRYSDAEEYLENAGYEVRRRFMVWCQGEADADNSRSEDTYKNNTLAVFENMKTAGVTDMFIVKTGHYNINYGLAEGEEPSADALAIDARYKNVNTWQQELADVTAHVYTAADLYTDSALANMRDQYHYYQPVYNEVGTTAGGAAAAAFDAGAEPVVPATYELGGASTIQVGEKEMMTVLNVTDSEGNDITDKAALTDFASSDPDVVSVSADGELEAKSAGTAEISFKLTVDELGWSRELAKTIKTGVYELTSDAASIDVSGMTSYGADTYRLYGEDGSYTDVKAENGTVENTTGGKVTVVPVYRLSYTSAAKSGHTDATGTYDAAAGYGLLEDGSYGTNENGSLPTESAPLHIDLPYGSYDMNISRAGGVRADVYCDGIQIINNTTSSGSQNRPSGTAVMYAPQVLVEDGAADITIGNTQGSNERIAAVELVRVPESCKKQIIWIAGDSEAANYYPIDSEGSDLESDNIMMTGFGMQLGRFLSADKYKIANWGQPSATVKTWYDECFESVLGRMEPGDTIIVDFGINDSISSSNKMSIEDMQSYMRDIFDAAKAKGVQPILVSPVWNGKYQHRSYFTYDAASDSNDMYAFAEECGVPCIDLNKGSMLYKDDAIKATGDPDWAVYNYHVGDNLHQTQHSALMNAAIIAGGMGRLGYEVTDHAYTYKDIDSFDASDSTARGNETGTERIYSVEALSGYVTVAGAAVSTEPPEPQAGISVKGDTVTVTHPDAKNAVLLSVSYDDKGELNGMDVYELTFENGTAAAQVKDIEPGSALYVWDSLEKMTPLFDKFIVTEPGAEPAPTDAVTEEPTAFPTVTPTEPAADEPTRTIYTQDFESFDEGSDGDWTTPAGTLAVKTDSTEGIGKYLAVTSGKNGTCRSGYVELTDEVTENFVFECDYRTNSSINVSDLELLESRKSVYANHGVYSNAQYAFIMARPKDSDLFVINNTVDDSGLTIDRYADPVFTTKEIKDGEWLHVKVVGNFDTKTVIASVTSLDGKTEYYRGKTNMSGGMDGWKCIHLLSPDPSSDTCIDNIVVRTAKASELSEAYHTVKLTLGAYSFDQYVADGGSVVNIPDHSAYGEYFLGWNVGGKLYSSAELASLPINADCEIKGEISGDYIENMASVEFADFPAGGELVMGVDENTYGSNPISLKITGEQGTSLVVSPDSRVTDYKIEWSFDGFRTLDGRPTGETGSVYCDSYGLIEITETAQASVDFRLKRTAANYYGRVKAKVTYNGKTIEVEKPLVLLGDKSGAGLLPRAGYHYDYNMYEDSLVGYIESSGDILLGGWQTVGSAPTTVTLLSDNGGKYMGVTMGSGNSSYLYNNIGNIDSQTVFEQDVRFGRDCAIRYIGGSVTSPDSTAFSFAKSGAELSLNGETVLENAETDKWYHIEITADPTSRLVYAEVYDTDGELLGKSDVTDLDASYTGGMYYEVALARDSSVKGSVDLNNIRVYEAETDSESIEAQMPETANIPESGSTEIELSAAAKTVDGAEAIGLFGWAIADELAEGVSIESVDRDSAKLTIESTASSGELPIRVSIGGKSAEFSIKLIGTKDNVAFVSAPQSILIGDTAEHTYTAEVRNGNAEKVEGREISYSLAASDGTAAAPEGVTIDPSSGKLTVAADAEPQTIYIKAVSQSADGTELTRLAKTVLYNLSFGFGSNITDGFTPVTADTIYSGGVGFGIEGTAKNSENGITGSGFTFKVKLEKGKVYDVKATYEGSIRCEAVDSTFTGFERSMDTLGEDSYSVAVFGDDIMDITADGTLKSIEITPVEKTAAEKPDWWTIGDSTVQQNGSWGYTIASTETTDLSKYPELAEVVNGFHNSGKAGEQHKNFYTNGRLNAILTQMSPGDVVSLSGMGTNDSSSTKEQFKAYDKLYVDAILDMGGYVILGSYTPTGNYGATEGKVYDSDSMTFKGMRTNAYDLAIRELYEEYKDKNGVLGFVDIGAMADEKMTADVRAAYDAAIADDAGESAARAAANATAAEMMAWWKDYNHYYTEFSNYILPDITKAVAELIAGR